MQEHLFLFYITGALNSVTFVILWSELLALEKKAHLFKPPQKVLPYSFAEYQTKRNRCLKDLLLALTLYDGLMANMSNRGSSNIG